MSASNRGPGRPPKPTEDTIRKQREFLAACNFGATVKSIAQSTGLAESWVSELVSRARDEVAAEANGPDVVNPAEGSQPKPLRRMNRRTVQFRAWEYAERHLISDFGLAVNSFWVRIIVAVHEDGDGHRLPIGTPGARFASRKSLADLLLGQLDRTAVDIDPWLKMLFDRGRLLDHDGGDIGIPHGLGLVPGEKSNGEPMAARGSKRSTDDNAPLPFRPQLVAGIEFDSGKIPPLNSGEIPVKSPISPESDSGEIRSAAPVKPVISPESSDVAYPPPSSSSSSFQPTDMSEESKEGSKGEGARASELSTPVKLPISPEIDSGKTPPATPVKPPISPETGARKTLLRDDWQPTAEAVAEMQAQGHDPSHVARKYRLYCADTGKLSNDHDAAFQVFYLKEDRFDPVPRGGAPPGNRPAKPDKGAFLDRDLDRMAEKYLGGPIIEGAAG